MAQMVGLVFAVHKADKDPMEEEGSRVDQAHL